MEKVLGEALIGLTGIILGFVLGEYFRRQRRIEVYSMLVFEKRLEIYEGLHALLCQCSDVAAEINNCSGIPEDMRKEWVSEMVLTMAEYTDENELFFRRHNGK